MSSALSIFNLELFILIVSVYSEEPAIVRVAAEKNRYPKSLRYGSDFLICCYLGQKKLFGEKNFKIG